MQPCMLTTFICISVLTAGHCCLGSISISVNISAYSLGGIPPLRYSDIKDESISTPRHYQNHESGRDLHWDVCIIDLPEHVSTIAPAPLGAALAYAHSPYMM